jgi:hypothetical protein
VALEHWVTNSKHPRVGGNELFIICTVCGPDISNSLRVAERRAAGFEHSLLERRDAEKFFAHHASCGGTRDHYKLAMLKVADWDANEIVDPATNIKGAVRLALVKP